MVFLLIPEVPPASPLLVVLEVLAVVTEVLVLAWLTFKAVLANNSTMDQCSLPTILTNPLWQMPTQLIQSTLGSISEMVVTLPSTSPQVRLKSTMLTIFPEILEVVKEVDMVDKLPIMVVVL